MNDYTYTLELLVDLKVKQILKEIEDGGKYEISNKKYLKYFNPKYDEPFYYTETYGYNFEDFGKAVQEKCSSYEELFDRIKCKIYTELSATLKVRL